MNTASSPIQLPVLRVDSAVWQCDGEAGDSRLTAHLTLGDLALRLEAWAIDKPHDHGPEYHAAYVQRTRIGHRPYAVVGFEEQPRAALATAV